MFLLVARGHRSIIVQSLWVKEVYVDSPPPAPSFSCMSVVCCLAFSCLLSIPSWAVGLAWSYVSSHISTGGGLDQPQHKKVSPFIQSDTAFPPTEVFLSTSSSHHHGLGGNHLGLGLMWGYVWGLGRICVTSPPLLQRPRTHCPPAYNQCVFFISSLIFSPHLPWSVIQWLNDLVLSLNLE